MKILIAPDKFRGSLDAEGVCRAAREGVLKACPGTHVITTPLADGGEGTAEILTTHSGGRFVTVRVHDPLEKKTEARYGISGDGQTAFIELSAASGLHLLSKKDRNPLLTSTYGTGELIAHALDAGVSLIILGIGGSATTDGGTGMASALGYRFLDEAGRELRPAGGNLRKISRIDTSGVHRGLHACRVMVACDVTNPLYGPEGAACMYGPQKGATEQMVSELDEGLRHLAGIAADTFGIDAAQHPGAGAAGGVGAGALWFLKAQLQEGIQIVMEQIGLPALVPEMDLVITGEGKVDEQTMKGKVVKGLATLCKQSEVPLAVICGTLLVTPEEAEQAGITYAVSILNRPASLEEVQAETAERITESAYYLTRLYSRARGFKCG